MVVERELHCRQPLCPVILKMVNVGTEIHLNLLIHPLRLPIRLRAEGSAQIRIHSNHRVELLHKARDALGASVTHNLLKDSIISEHSVAENTCSSKSCKVDPNPLDQCPLCEFIDDNKEGVMSDCEGEGNE